MEFITTFDWKEIPVDVLQVRFITLSQWSWF
jgi:hypothetical protein